MEQRKKVLKESEYETRCNLTSEDALRAVNLIKKDDAVFVNAYDDMRNGYGRQQFFKDHKGYMSDEDLELMWDAAEDFLSYADELSDKDGKPLKNYQKFYDVVYGGEVPKSAMYDDREDDEEWEEAYERKQKELAQKEYDDLVKKIHNEGLIATDISIHHRGGCSVYVQTKDGTWGDWFALWLSDGDVEGEWSNLYRDDYDIRDENKVCEIAYWKAFDYAREKGRIYFQ